MSAQKILITDNISADAVEKLNEMGFDAVLLDTMPEQELAEKIGEYDAIAIRSATKLTPAVFANPGNLKIAVRGGVGIDNINVPAATEKNIAVANTPGANTIATAELAFALMLSLARNIPDAHASLVAGRWDRKLFKGVELFGKTLGLVGFGRIGREIAKRAQAFAMDVVAFDPYLTDDVFNEAGVKKVDLDSLYGVSDYISLHLPATDETKGMINSGAIAKMKKGVRIINAARGPLLNDVDVAAGMDDGIIAGVALDVYPSEPPAEDYALLNKKGVVHVPHLGASSVEAQDKVGVEVVKVIADFLLHKTGDSIVNLKDLKL